MARARIARGLQGRVALLLFAAVLAPTVAMPLLGWRSLSELREALLSERKAHAVALARLLDRDLREAFEALAAVPAEGDERAIRSALREACRRARPCRAAYLLDARGNVQAAEGPAALPSIDFRGIPKARVALSSGRPTVTRDPRAPAEAPLYAIVPLRDSEGRVAEAAAVAWDPLAADGNLPVLAPPARIALLDEEGRLLAGSAAIGREPEILALAPIEVLHGAIAIVEPEAHLEGSLASLRLRWLEAAVFFLALAAIYGVGVARSLKRPLGQLSEVAAAIAAGDLDRPVPISGSGEIGRLGRSFEAMRQALAASLHRTLLRRAITAQEEERKRIARELHDETCQTLAALSMHLALADRAPEAASMRAEIAEAKALASRGADEIHSVILDLRPSVLDDLGLVAAIHWLALRHLGARGVKVHFDADEERLRLPPDTEIALFRAAQEAIVNAARHADAGTVWIRIGTRGECFEVEVEDDGRGFDPEEVAEPSVTGRGLGLQGLRERLAMIGGSVRIESSPGEGSSVTFRVPVEAPVHV